MRDFRFRRKNEDCSFLLVDRESHRHKFDTKLKHEESGKKVIDRVKADIADLVLDRIPLLKSSDRRVFGVSKHLCGTATDFALRCLAEYCGSGNGVCGILFALCCHHKCEWNQFVGKEFLTENGFDERLFGLLCGLTSWATCGSGRPRDNRIPVPQKTKPDNKDNPHLFRYDRLDLPRERRESLGKKVKRILDFARAEFVRKTISAENVQLRYYCKTEISLENVVLIAY